MPTTTIAVTSVYERVVVTRDTTDGPVQTETERHPDPEAIRWQIREGEVIQAVGRARAPTAPRRTRLRCW
jgi:hypothetical protein